MSDIEKLETLANLKEKGFLSNEEYVSEKAKLLNAPPEPTNAKPPPRDQSDPFIQNGLEGYDERIDGVRCLECGYKGTMGVIKTVTPWYASWWCVGMASYSILAEILKVRISGFPACILLGVILLTVQGICSYKLYRCPNCNSHLRGN